MLLSIDTIKLIILHNKNLSMLKYISILILVISLTRATGQEVILLEQDSVFGNHQNIEGLRQISRATRLQSLRGRRIRKGPDAAQA